MNLSGLQHQRAAIITWLVLVLISLVIISRSHFTADLSAFLPSTPTAEQQLLMDQLKDGLSSRLILVGIQGQDATSRATLSKNMAQMLRDNPAFVSVNNGEPVTSERDHDYLFNNRYLLSPTVSPQRFSENGLQAAISQSIDRIASPAGLLLKSLLPNDPTGEMWQLLDQMHADSRPQLLDGAWASHDGETALLLLQTRALGSDIDAQKQAMQAIEQAFAKSQVNTLNDAKLLLTGPGVFSVSARDTIKSQVRAIFILSTLLIALLLLLIYRSFSALLLGFLPVATGILAGIASVSMVYGVVHGITLGFGTALIGEAVDYSIYLFIQSDRASGNKDKQQRQTSQKQWLKHVWPTVRLGVLTSVFGFAALLLSDFPGLAQLGLYSTVGLIAAAAMTRYVLPHLLPASFQIQDLAGAGLKLSYFAQLAIKLRWPAVGLIVASSVVVYQHHQHLWNTELAALSPLSVADQELDAQLRAGMGAPDVRYVVVVSGHDQESVLGASEKVSTALQTLVEKGGLKAFDSASQYLPSQATQRARQTSLPDATALKFRLKSALSHLPVRPQILTPFLSDVETSRNRPLLQREDLNGTSMALAVDAMLLNQGQRWSALIPLTAPENGDIDVAQVRAALDRAQVTDAVFVDIKAESDRLYASYLQEAILLSLAGLFAIILLLMLVLRSAMRVIAVTGPLLAAVLTVTAGLALFGQKLMILHLIGLLLIVAIGSNYALFFNQAQGQDGAVQPVLPRTYVSLLFANVATVLGFGLLAFSSVPVLQALGTTVAPGVILALIFSAIFAHKS